LDEALDDAEQALTTMISLLEAGNLDPLSNEQTISWWQRFETFRNKLPLVDHGLIAHGEASDLPRKDFLDHDPVLGASAAALLR
jgi:hypothetical protein